MESGMVLGNERAIDGILKVKSNMDSVCFRNSKRAIAALKVTNLGLIR
jgi:hypothetical protein